MLLYFNFSLLVAIQTNYIIIYKKSESWRIQVPDGPVHLASAKCLANPWSTRFWSVFFFIAMMVSNAMIFTKVLFPGSSSSTGTSPSPRIIPTKKLWATSEKNKVMDHNKSHRKVNITKIAFNCTRIRELLSCAASWGTNVPMSPNERIWKYVKV